MRLIGTLDKEPDAQRFAAHLVTEGIQAHTELENGHWAIWVRDENRIAEAKNALIEFRRDPMAPAYRGAERAAESLRREETRRNEEAKKNVVNMRGKWKRGGGAARRKPLIMTLIAISVLVAIGSGMGEDRRGSVLRTLLFTDVQHLNDPDVDWSTPEAKLIDIKRGEVWRLVTPIFIHFGAMHLIFNMIMIYQLGSMVEDRCGTLQLGWMVLVIAVASNLCQALVPVEWGGGSPLFGGMSGVLYGVFGYLCIKSTFQPELGMRIPQSTVIILIGWMLLGFAGVFESMGLHMANWAHGIGFAAGVIIAAVPLALRGK